MYAWISSILSTGLSERVVGLLQAGVIGFFAWLIKEALGRRHLDRQEQLRAVLSDRLGGAYGPLYLLVGRYLTSVGKRENEREQYRSEIEKVIRDKGYHLRPSHYNYCARLVSGDVPSDLETSRVRYAMYLECRRLTQILYRDVKAFETVAVMGPAAAVGYWVGRIVEFAGAALLWVFLFAGMAAAVVLVSTAYWMDIAILLLLMAIIVGVRAVVAQLTYTRQFSGDKWPTLKRGSKGTRVEMVQNMLALAGFEVGAHGADGIFGQSTETALKFFQTKVGIRVNGKANAKTVSTLYRFLEVKDRPPSS